MTKPAVVEVKTRASEAKGPFPGGKRVGSRGEEKEKKKVKEKETEKGAWRASADLHPLAVTVFTGEGE